ncbi:MAG: hypothetical protein JWL97_3661 [Gemmatimonadales bacterium]|jgi:hypothetical protein|nr:hypothetical protein [Gemmatimonadales bacterium]
MITFCHRCRFPHGKVISVNVMKPPAGAQDGVLRHADAFDVPILVRSTPARRPFPQWRQASDPWPPSGTVPPPGWYLATPLWREIIKHGAEVGRDLTPWLLQLPQLAGQELLARISPLQAYLSLALDQTKPHPHNAGRRLKPSVVYDHGTERSAKGAFAYRLGMTMAQWVCCGLMGLGRTTHIETRGPAGIEAFTNPAGQCPDLWGRHYTDSRPWWLIEAKAAHKLGLPELNKGCGQLWAGSALMGGHPHRLLLCGTSLHKEVFMTIDDLPTGLPGAAEIGFPRPTDGDDPEDHLDEDDDALIGTAESQMLTYLNLRYGPATSLHLIPLSDQRTGRPRARFGSLTPLEDDPATAEVRRRLRVDPLTVRERQQSQVADFIVGPVRGTDVRLGMSRQLFGACERLFLDRVRIMDETSGMGLPTAAPPSSLEEVDPDEEALAQVNYEYRMRYRDREFEDRNRIREDVRRAYREADQSTWPELLGRAEPPMEIADDRLEAATAQTYISIDPTDPLLAPADLR